jgi:hypothetical protein
MRHLLVLACALVSLVACSGAPLGDAPDFELGQGDGEDDASAPAPPPSDAGTDTTGRRVTTFRGSLAATEKVAFGGSPYCVYEIVLEDITVDLRMLESGEITDVAVQNRVVEHAADGCPHEPMSPSAHEYRLAQATKTPSGARITFTGAEANRPKTELVMELSPEGRRYRAAMQWKRVDFEAPLDWTVEAALPLSRE